MRKRNSALLAGLLASALSLPVSPVVFACGESLFPVGKGLIFRSYATPLPGRILVVAHSPGALQMVEQLRAAGHDVQVVSEPEQIGASLGKADFDIVMSLFKQRQAVAAQMGAAGSAATYLPVAEHDSPEIQQAQASAPRYLSTDDNVKTFLRVIHRTLKDQQV